MKSTVLFLGTLCFIFLSQLTSAQDNKKTSMTATKKSDRVSPLESTSASQNGLQVTIEYSAPGVKSRTIWGELVPYGKVWRTGANEATTIEFSRDAMINNNRVRAGKYALFTIPGENEWVVILNTVPEQWGAFKYDENKDALRFTVKPQPSPEFNERLKFEAQPDNQNNSISVAFLWENLMLSWVAK